MQIQDLVTYLNNYAKTENQIENYYVEVNSESKTGVVVRNSVGDIIDQVELDEEQL